MTSRRDLPFVLGILLAASACGGDPSSADADLVDASADAGPLGPRDIGVGGDSGETPSFAILEELLQDKVASGAISGYAVQIYDGDDTLLFESDGGVCRSPQNACPSGSQPFTVDLVTGVASSSKWVTSTVLLAAVDELVDEGALPSVAAGLDTTVGTILSGTCGAGTLGRGANVTLRQLLSFTSGLLPDHGCVDDRALTMQQCACRILSDSADVEVATPDAGTTANHAQPPGTVFKYGAAAHVVAAAMLEVATGEPYTDLFQRLVQAPTGMSAFYQSEKNIAGSMRASVSDYARFVRAIYHAGAPGTLLSAEALEEQERNQLPPDVVRRSQLQPGLDYGLNTWRWCYRNTDAETLLALGRTPEAFTPEDLLGIQDASCSELHQQGHGGKGGYQPWVDRRRGFYGVFAMREPSAGGGDQYSYSELSLTAVVRLYAGLVVEELRAL
ncbi:MAG: beta-lactamase family protein [Myxococcota bacterium]|jgi:CubicO group peptidase (beta-lactamase class C family)|nr:beta-lactamase family protein [Myxococcota bacterium]